MAAARNASHGSAMPMARAKPTGSPDLRACIASGFALQAAIASGDGKPKALVVVDDVRCGPGWGANA